MGARQGGPPGGLQEQGDTGAATLGVAGRSHLHLRAFARDGRCLEKKSGVYVRPGGGEGTVKPL